MLNEKKNVIINIDSQNLYDAVMKKLESEGYKWAGGGSLTEDSFNYYDRRNNRKNFYLKFIPETHTVVYGGDYEGTYSKEVTITAKKFIGKNDTIVIYQKDNTVVALNKITGKKSIAKCHPDDEFDFNVGAKIAFNRLMDDEAVNDVPTEEATKRSILKFKIGDEVVLNPSCKIGKTYGGITLLDKMAEYGKVFKITSERFSASGGEVYGVIYELSDNIYDYSEEMLMPASEAIKVGDEVQVTDDGCSYVTYASWVNKNVTNDNAKVRYNYGERAKMGMIGKVIAIAPHLTDKKILVYIIDESKYYTNNYYLIGIEGVEKVYEF